ncbi:MAG: TrkH family potassium uptake protein [Planctomycetes bacterium]|nr:TrkH family potassium uptake protein [Planctomycetota bacterium]
MRQAAYLRQRYRAILAYTGMVVGIAGILMLTPLAALLAWPEEARFAGAFLIPGIALGVGGLTLWRLLHPGDIDLSLQEGGVIVLLSWVVAFIASALPLMSVEGMDFTCGVFESVSGWTTTGLSVVDVARARHVTLLWRSVMQLAGGAGLAILMLAAVTGVTGPVLSAAEGRTDQLAPNVRASAVLVLRIYAGFVAFGVLAYRVAGMGWFDSFNHAFAALSTGGFSTRAESLGYWDSSLIEGVTIVLMLLGSLNFITAWTLLRGRLCAFCRSSEVRMTGVLVLLCTVLAFWLTARPLYPAAGKAWRVAIFETVTALTTTGFSTVGYGNWNPFGILILLVLMWIGGGTCSTAGGIKQYRVYVVYRSLRRALRRPFLPRTAITHDTLWDGESTTIIDDARVSIVGTYLFLYVSTCLLGASILAAHGYGLQESLFEYASALGTVGLSIGITRSDAPRLVLWAEMVGMFLGRLEFFVIITSAARLVRDSLRMARPCSGDASETLAL